MAICRKCHRRMSKEKLNCRKCHRRMSKEKLKRHYKNCVPSKKHIDLYLKSKGVDVEERRKEREKLKEKHKGDLKNDNRI